MMLPAIDAHAHVDVRIAPQELSALDALVLAVTRSLSEWQAAAARDDEMTLWGVGCHPALPDAVHAFDPREFLDALETASFVGEVGIDNRSKATRDTQVAVFEEILRAVQRVQRPMSIHSSGATKRVLDLLEAIPIATPILHWWRGTRAETLRALELGCYFSFNGHEAVRPKTIDLIPLERVLTETDFPHSRRYDELASRPAATALIERALMLHHGIALGELRERLWSNLRTVCATTRDLRPASSRLGQLLRDPASVARVDRSLS
jgi:TatD DNase family protein